MRSLRLLYRVVGKAKAGGGAARKEVSAVTHGRKTSNLTGGRALGLKREQGFVGGGGRGGLRFISICSRDRGTPVLPYTQRTDPRHLV